jgi:CRISPR-associated protein Cas1
MRKLLNTVYITSEGAGLRKDGENLVAEVDGIERARIPLHMLASVVVFGAIFVSPALMQACAASGITIALLDRNGRFQARIEGPVTGNVLLRRAQYRLSDQPEEIVRSFLVGKVANQRSVLMRALRDYGDEYGQAERDAIVAAIRSIGFAVRKEKRPTSILGFSIILSGRPTRLCAGRVGPAVRPSIRSMRFYRFFTRC